MVQTLTRRQAREIDRRAIEEYGVPGVVLMENAGRGAADILLAQEVLGSVLVCCGPGNNGGDGFVIARHLDNRGVAVKVALLAAPEELRGDAKINFNILVKSQLPVIPLHEGLFSEGRFQAELDEAEWVVDALLGTGLESRPRTPIDRAIELINDSPARVIAIDLPSGLDCDSGRPLGVAVRASHTVTFVAAKKGFAAEEAEEFLGQVHVVDIGAPRRLIDAVTGS